MMMQSSLAGNPAYGGGKVVDLAEYRLWRALRAPAGGASVPVERFASVGEYARRTAGRGCCPLPPLPRRSAVRRARRAAVTQLLSTGAVLLATCMATVQLLG